jgi:hypothetical protein
MVTGSIFITATIIMVDAIPPSFSSSQKQSTRKSREEKGTNVDFFLSNASLLPPSSAVIIITTANSTATTNYSITNQGNHKHCPKPSTLPHKHYDPSPLLTQHSHNTTINHNVPSWAQTRCHCPYSLCRLGGKTASVDATTICSPPPKKSKTFRNVPDLCFKSNEANKTG